MLNKLAFRNARRSAKDYIVYLLTMTVMAAMMFAFDSMALSDSVLSLCEEAAVMGWMIGIASAFIIGILAWLIRYMCRFMLEKRSREFGTYLLLGMNKKQVSRLYMKENLWMGALAFVLGLFAGAFLQQILMTVFYRVFSMDYPLHVEINGWSMLMTAIVYVLCYVFALFRSRKLFGKMTIADFMNMEKENEKMKDGRTGIAQFWLFAAVGYFIFYNIMLHHAPARTLYGMGCLPDRCGIYRRHVSVLLWTVGLFCSVCEKEAGGTLQAGQTVSHPAVCGEA